MNAVDEADGGPPGGDLAEHRGQTTTCASWFSAGDGEKAFSAGADMKAGGSSKERFGAYWEDARKGGFRWPGNAPQPCTCRSLLRVNGLAVGGGFEMVLGCDIVVAAEHASFGSAGGAGRPYAARRRHDHTSENHPTENSDGYDAHWKQNIGSRGLDYGVVNEVAAAGELDAVVDRWVEQILKCAPLSVKAIKESVKETIDLPIDEAKALRLPSLVAALESEDGDEGPRAFREKRAPVWKGR